MQSIPVDVGRLGSLLCVVEPAPKLVSVETGEVKTDRDGRTVWTVGLAVREGSGRRASIVEVSVPGEPVGVVVGMPVQVTDLVAVSWQMGDRHGVSFRASAVTPVVPAVARVARGGGEQ